MVGSKAIAAKSPTSESRSERKTPAPPENVTESEFNPIWNTLATRANRDLSGATSPTDPDSGSIQQTVSGKTNATVVQRACSECDEEQGQEQSDFVQTKLTVSPPDDPYEQEADQVADHVM